MSGRHSGSYGDNLYVEALATNHTAGATRQLMTACGLDGRSGRRRDHLIPLPSYLLVMTSSEPVQTGQRDHLRRGPNEVATAMAADLRQL
jgi:hypothetical protein